MERLLGLVVSSLVCLVESMARAGLDRTALGEISTVLVRGRAQLAQEAEPAPPDCKESEEVRMASACTGWVLG